MCVSVCACADADASNADGDGVAGAGAVLCKARMARSGQHASGCVICDSGFGSLSSGYRVGGDAGIPPRTKASR